MRYVLGVDSGQTTTAIVADETGCLLGMGMGGPALNLQEPGGAARAQKSLGDAIAGAVRMADLQNARIAACCLGTRGDQAQTEVVCAPVVPTADLIFVPDTRIALYSVTLGRPGVVVAAGVSAGAYGVNASGESASCGGWGSLMGDEGSGYWIALRALNACCRAHDGIDAPTSLLPLVLRHLDAEDLPHVQRLMASDRLRCADVAGLSEVVSRAAAQGDKTARRILREAGKELALGAQSALRRLNMEGDAVIVGTVGGVFRAGRAVLRTFREMVLQTAPNARIVPARVPPAAGAALIALEAIDVPVRDDILTNLEAALPRLQLVKS